MRKLIYYWLPVVVWAAIIIQATGRTFDAPHTSGWLTALLGNLPPRTLHIINVAMRKTAHLTEYAILTALSFRAVREGRSGFTLRWALIALAITVCVASTDEFLQSFTPTRTSTPWDVLLDTVGGTIAMTGMWRHER
ncbi:MAG TPA: VanZ family protein [Thermoanaerobaculia bacterium]|jgi:VanZ family protein